MKPVLKKAVGDDADLERTVIRLFSLQIQMPKARILAATPNHLLKDNEGMANMKEEVAFCVDLAKQ